MGGGPGHRKIGQPLELPSLPAIPFSQSDLLGNAEGQPNIGSELQAELASAHSVNLLCAFVIESGVRHLQNELQAVIERGGQVRVITTTYMGATRKAAVDRLHELGAQIKVAFDARTTKLHAKAWLLQRPSDLDTAYIGSSKRFHTALFDGPEWNVRLSAQDASHVIDRVRMTFESRWASEHFETYDPSGSPGTWKRCPRIEEPSAASIRRKAPSASPATPGRTSAVPSSNRRTQMTWPRFRR